MTVCRVLRLTLSLTVLAVVACEEEPPMERPQPPPHQRGLKPPPEKVKPAEVAPKVDDGTDALAKTSGTDSSDGTDKSDGSDKSDGTDASDGSDKVVVKAPAPKRLPPAGPPKDDPNLLSRPTTRVAPTPASCGIGKGAALEQSITLEPSADQPELRIVTPEPGKLLLGTRLRVRVTTKSLKTWKDKWGGQHLVVILDNEKPRRWYDPNENPLTIDGLSPGMHTLRVFAVRPWGEVIRAPKAFDAVNFYVRTSREAPTPWNFSKPLLTASLPSGVYEGADAERILLDFHVANVTLGSSGYKVRATLNDGPPMDITRWAPTWLERPPVGKHRIKLELIDPGGKPVTAPFHPIEGEFEVRR